MQVWQQPVIGCIPDESVVTTAAIATMARAKPTSELVISMQPSCSGQQRAAADSELVVKSWRLARRDRQSSPVWR
jgi:hypothetical protein